MDISTHTPRAGRDGWLTCWLNLSQTFLLTRPVRGATASPEYPAKCQKISTHTPRAGRDWLRGRKPPLP